MELLLAMKNLSGKANLIIQWLYRVFMLLIFLVALRLLSGMTRIACAAVGVAAIILSVFFNRLSVRIRTLVVLGFTVLFMLLSVFYNHSRLESIFPMHTTENQKIYQSYNREEKSMPDAYLRSVIRDKSVAIPYGVQPYVYYNPITDEEERGSGFVADYYIEDNYARYFLEYSNGYTDEELPKTDEVSALMDGRTADFSDLGITNDMLRYSFVLNKEHSKETKYFWYSWYYLSFAVDENHFPHLYVEETSAAKEPELVAIWDKGENLYVCGRAYYEENIGGIR